MDKYQDYVRAVRELGLQPLRIDEFESLTGVMSMSEIINLTAKKSGTDREELAEEMKDSISIQIQWMREIVH
jgi:hypothetical protein